MGLSKLDNFLKNIHEYNILYVNPNDLDATDSIENRKSWGRPLYTETQLKTFRFHIQRE